MFSFMKAQDAPRGEYAARPRAAGGGADAHFVNATRCRRSQAIQRVRFNMAAWERAAILASAVYSSAVGYSGAARQSDTRKNGMTNHTEAVLVAFDPKLVSFDELLRVFWEGHDPTQGMRQGNDAGSQYRSAIYTCGEQQMNAALASRERFQQQLKRAGFGAITTEILPALEFYYAEDYHQQYLGKNPNGYCGLGGTGVSCPAGVLAKALA